MYHSSKQAKEDFLDVGVLPRGEGPENRGDNVYTYHDGEGHDQKVTYTTSTCTLYKYLKHY